MKLTRTNIAVNPLFVSEVTLLINKIMKTYYIYRFYSDENRNKRLITTFNTLKEAQEYCQREDTHKKGVWFDGYSDKKQ